MAVHGSNSQVLIAEYDLSAYLTSVEVGIERATHDVTTLSKDSVERHSGLFDGSATLAGLYDAGIDDDIAGWVGSAAGEPFTLVLDTPALGGRTRHGTVKHARYRVSNPVGGMVASSVELESDGGMWSGELLHVLGAESATGNESTVDSGADWVGVDQGGVAIVHLTAATALTSLDVKVQDSPNDSAWADLATFTQLTALGSEVVVVPLGTQVDRYLRAEWTLVGTSVTFSVAFARWTHSA
jgi:hypothetical protein